LLLIVELDLAHQQAGEPARLVVQRLFAGGGRQARGGESPAGTLHAARRPHLGGGGGEPGPAAPLEGIGPGLPGDERRDGSERRLGGGIRRAGGIGGGGAGERGGSGRGGRRARRHGAQAAGAGQDGRHGIVERAAGRQLGGAED